jgi:hypothetical protein
MHQDEQGSGENGYGVVIQYSSQELVGMMEPSVWMRAFNWQQAGGDRAGFTLVRMYQDEQGNGENGYGVVIRYSSQELVGVTELLIWTRAFIQRQAGRNGAGFTLGGCTKTSKGAEKMGLEL